MSYGKAMLKAAHQAKKTGKEWFVIWDWEFKTHQAVDEDEVDWLLDIGDLKEGEIKWCSSEA